jgi:hypothetical protein
MRGAIPPLPLYVFMAWCLVKHGDNFTFTFFNVFFTSFLLSLLFQFLFLTRQVTVSVTLGLYSGDS